MMTEQENAVNTGNGGQVEKHIWYYSSKALRGCAWLCGFITLVFLVFTAYLPMSVWVGLMLIPAISWIWVSILCWYRTNFIQYRLTESNLYAEKGFMHKTIDTLELMGISDLKMEQSLWDRLINGGTGKIRVYSHLDKTDSELVMSGIENPREVLEIIDVARRRLRGKGIVQI
ncbi:MAG: PH domain-containing protein [Thermoguttaceae bacterium]